MLPGVPSCRTCEDCPRADMMRNSRSTACAEASTLPGGFLRSTYLSWPACECCTLSPLPHCSMACNGRQACMFGLHILLACTRYVGLLWPCANWCTVSCVSPGKPGMCRTRYACSASCNVRWDVSNQVMIACRQWAQNLSCYTRHEARTSSRTCAGAGTTARLVVDSTIVQCQISVPTRHSCMPARVAVARAPGWVQPCKQCIRAVRRYMHQSTRRHPVRQGRDNLDCTELQAEAGVCSRLVKQHFRARV
jgi:hypothetical protein